ncbi:MAG: hypothetical protein WCC60_06050 [Ilumatobacteraceae bacterium]
METLTLQHRGANGARVRVRRVRNGRRRSLEAAGWRTWLTYHENHRRDATGRMVAIEERWVVELEHVEGRSFQVEAPSPAAAWLAAWECVRS